MVAPEPETLADIARRTGRPLDTVRHTWARSSDWPAPTGKRGRWHTYHPAAVDAWIAQHVARPLPGLDPARLYTVAEITDRTGLEPSTIYADRSRGRWPTPDDTTDGTDRWRGRTVLQTLSGRRGWATLLSSADAPYARELASGLVEPGTDDAACIRCGRQALLYVLDVDERQHMTCPEHHGLVMLQLLRGELD